MDDMEQLRPTLKEAEDTLRSSLEQACSTDPEQADTGELIRLEEVLSIATDAAKRAVSVRRRLRQRKRTTPPGGVKQADASGPRTEGHDATIHPALVHRSFRDARGAEWSVWSVYPENPEKAAALRGSFAKGWLAFECDAERRRLSPIPENWQKLDAEALAALCEQAARVTRGRRSEERPRPADVTPPAPDAPAAPDA